MSVQLCLLPRECKMHTKLCLVSYVILSVTMTVIASANNSLAPIELYKQLGLDSDLSNDFDIPKETTVKTTFGFLFKFLRVPMVYTGHMANHSTEVKFRLCVDKSSVTNCDVTANFTLTFTINHQITDRHFQMSFLVPFTSGYTAQMLTKTFGSKLGKLKNPLLIDMVLSAPPKNKTIKIKFRWTIGFHFVDVTGRIIVKDIFRLQYTVALGARKHIHKKVVIDNENQIRFAFNFFRNPCESRSDPCNGYFHCNAKNEKVCNKHYYGDSCKRYCKAENSTVERYICDENGYPVCVKYWYGPLCSVYCKEEQSVTSSFKCGIDGKKECAEGFMKWKDECVNDCKKNTLCVHGRCRDRHVGDTECKCFKGYKGKHCKQITCYAGYCKNGGTCKMHRHKRICHCLPDFHTERCAYISPCAWRNKDNPCLNFGECINQDGIFYCACLSGYTGKKCEILPVIGNIRLKPLFNWDVKDTQIQILIGVMVFTFVYTIAIVWLCAPRVIDIC